MHWFHKNQLVCVRIENYHIYQPIDFVFQRVYFT